MISGGSGGNSQDFDLNLASIIDCFTVLIAFMLVSASFLSIGVFDAGIAASGETAKSDTPPSIEVSVELTANQGILLKTNGKAHSSTHIVPAQGKRDLARLETELQELRKKWPDVQAVTLTSENQIAYSEIVLAMETLRKSVPGVLLGGF